MKYDRTDLVDRIRKELAARPNASLRTVQRVMLVERHVIEHACRLGGTTFLELRQETRFQKAREWLSRADETASMKEIAAGLGYSARSFSRFVRARCGETPTALLRRLRDESNRRLPRKSTSTSP